MPRKYTRHGMTDTPEYDTYLRIKDRCCNPNSPAYSRYRGLLKFESFEAFYGEIGPRPGDGYSVDRIDNNRGYEPGNVRWATQKQQNRNASFNRLVTFAGKTKCVAEWCEELGLNVNTVRTRIRRKWPIEKALFGQRYERVIEKGKSVDRAWEESKRKQKPCYNCEL